MNKLLYLLASMALAHLALAQNNKLSKYDVYKGKLNPMRSCYDVKFYDIQVKVIPNQKKLIGSNEIHFLAMNDFQKMQIDLDNRMRIDSVVFNQQLISFTRDSSIVIIDLSTKLKKNQHQQVKVYFSGIPIEAKKAPWDGGFVWKKDSLGRDWVGVACESIGASVWLPSKDHWSDEPDSMRMNLIVPSDLVGVSNGKFSGKKDLHDGYTQYTWQVSYPINLYGITINIGKYEWINDTYHSRTEEKRDALNLSYYVLDYHVAIANKHFKQVHTMLSCYERFFGLYPFWNDGYKLVEAPYWGMEHQSCVAYGHDFSNNRYDFDFIIIHESAHEWFANSITADDPAEMWIHESFTTYAEALYVECMQGKKVYVQYLKDQKPEIKNKFPIIGERDVYFHGRTDNDVYYKGSWVIHTMRHVIDDDAAFFSLLKKFYQTHQYKIINTDKIIRFFNNNTNRKWDAFFEQYLKQPELPLLEYKIDKGNDGKLIVRYRWSSKTVKGFEMPIKVTMTKDKWETVTPMKSWQLIDLNFFDEMDFNIQTDHFLIKTKRIE